MKKFLGRLLIYAGILKILIFVIMSSWWLLAEPSHNRNWSPEYTRLPKVTWHSSSTLHVANVRDWLFTDTSFPTKQNYVDETFDLNTIVKTWFFIEPFSSWSAVGHTFFSFEFADGRSIIVSVEARKELNEEYSGIRSLFPTYEYMYVWTTERDMLTNTVFFAKDNIYRYPLTISLESQKELFRALAQGTAELYEQPRFYHLLGANCTNILARHANYVQPDAIPFHYSWFLTGYADTYLYKLGYIPHDLPFTEIERQAFFTPTIRSAIATGAGANSTTFSAVIRR